MQFGGALAATLVPAHRRRRVGRPAPGPRPRRCCWPSRVPRLRGRSRADWLTVSPSRVALGLMNLAFYASLARLPIGVAVTIEFIGPLVARHRAVTPAARPRRGRRRRRWAWCSSPGPDRARRTSSRSPGILLALAAGACWAAYILLSARTGSRSSRSWTAWRSPWPSPPWWWRRWGWPRPAPLLDTWDALWRGAGIALLSSVLPYSLELIALRRLSARVFGVLLSLEPAVAALAGLVVLGQRLTRPQLLGLALRRWRPAPR